ncbi:MAG TPA: DMT family transporter [Candidatus Aphodousia faecigallinarum]|uniref:DMT family transporter n=1 Tax=Candidatus Aphodousia faecigallinarum TaxID=2840677 RepID=A0A9D1IHC0_9BURK|nr:DMT family transporter [Candidatus Aphodousia faecigallinarum]
MLSYAFIALHLSILFAGFTGVLGRLITLNEGLLVWYRVMMASGFFLLYLAISRGQIRLGFKDIFRIAWVGLLLSIHWLLFYGSIKYSNVSIGVVCFASVGFFTAIIDPFWSKRAFSIREVAFSLLTILGIALIFHFDTRYQVGIILGILSAIAASVLTIETRRVGSDYPPMTFLFYEVLSSFVIMSAILPIYLAIFPVETIAPSVSDLIYLLLLSSFCTVGLFYFQLEALKDLSAFTVNLSFNLEPVYSIILAMIIFHEAKDLNFSFYIGLFLICLSVLLQSYFHWKSYQKLQKSAAARAR